LTLAIPQVALASNSSFSLQASLEALPRPTLQVVRLQKSAPNVVLPISMHVNSPKPEAALTISDV
jgi:hypothetical protein